MLPILPKPTTTATTTSTVTAPEPAPLPPTPPTPPPPPATDEFSTGRGSALRARALSAIGSSPIAPAAVPAAVSLKGFGGLDIPSPSDVGGWVKDRFEDGVEAGGTFVDRALDRFNEVRERFGDAVLDEALGINADRIESLSEGDQLVIGGELSIAAEVEGGIAAGVTLVRTGPDEYTATVNAEVLAGLGLADTDLTGGAGGTAEFTFSSKEEALEGLQALGKLNLLGVTVTGDEVEALTSSLSAVQVDSGLSAGLGARVGLDDVHAQGAGAGATQASHTRIEFEDGAPSAVVFGFDQTVDASAVNTSLTSELPVDGSYALTAEYGAELRFNLPELEGDSLQDKVANLLEGEGRVSYAAPEVTVRAEVTGTKDDSGAVASIEGTLRPGQLPAFFEELANGSWDDAFGAVAHVEGRARTWEDDTHATDFGADLVVGSANFDNYTRHYGDDHSFELGRPS